MIELIGETAGKMWQYLNEHGEVATAKLARRIESRRDLAQRAIGWLAREEKIRIPMTELIGETAGKMWQYLNEHGEVATAKLARRIETRRDLAQRAIGWLARERKIKIEKVQRNEIISLT